MAVLSFLHPSGQGSEWQRIPEGNTLPVIGIATRIPTGAKIITGALSSPSGERPASRRPAKKK